MTQTAARMIESLIEQLNADHGYPLPEFPPAVRAMASLVLRVVADELDRQGEDLRSLALHVVEKEEEQRPDSYCVTLPNGECISNHPKCMHQPR